MGGLRWVTFGSEFWMAFDGFSKAALVFFRGLEKNNNREWFAARKGVFEEQVKGPMVELAGEVNGWLGRHAVEYALENPAKAIFRIYRDTRFSKDKTPYKTHIAAAFARKGLTRRYAAEFYFAVSDKGVDVAGGMYMPGPEELKALRGRLAKEHGAFAKLTGDKALVRALGPLRGAKMARVPKGFEADDPAAEWLKFKQVYFHVELDAKLALSRRVVKEVTGRFEQVLPVVDWINEAILAGREEGEESVVKRPAPMW